jgi:hypothetical protein
MFVNGLEFVLYATGNIIGPFLFSPSQAPRYLTAIWALVGIEAAGILFTVLMGLWMWRENKNRDKNTEHYPEQGTEAGFSDHTDMENKAFRYKL